MTFYEKEILRIRNSCFSNSRQTESIIGTRTYIDNHFNKELNLDILSFARFTSKFHLLRLFKRYYGMTPKQYLVTKRIIESKKLLEKGMTIAEVCYLVGFETPSSFSTLFKSKTGLTPSGYQKKAIFTKCI
jgi:AraC-like DNA-binding protein